MNLELNWSVTAHGLVYINNALLNNVFDIQVTLTTNTDSAADQLVTYGRQKVFLSTILDDSIFLDYTKQNHKFLITELSQNFVYLPDAPADHIICAALFYKLSAIADKKLTVQKVELASRIGDDVYYSMTPNYSVAAFKKDPPWLIGTKIKPWWHRNDTTTRDDFLLNGDFIETELTWEELDLAYPASTKDSSIFTVIKGGKDEK